MLRQLLDSLAAQQTAGEFHHRILVVDNDPAGSARQVIEEFRERHAVPLDYRTLSDPSIPKARNATLEHASGDYLALIDDDEVASESWLLSLLRSCVANGADGALGPVVPRFQSEPPAWIVAGRFHEKGTDQGPHWMTWHETRTSNVLLRRASVGEVRFGEAFVRGGEDVDFFMRLMEGGRRFWWSPESVVYESIPAQRCTRGFLLRRALLRGRVTHEYRVFGPRFVLKSLIAVPVYVTILPAIALTGHHRVMDILIRTAEHLGLLLGLVGIDPVRRR